MSTEEKSSHVESSPTKKKGRKRIEFPDDPSQVKPPVRQVVCSQAHSVDQAAILATVTEASLQEPRKRQRVPPLPSAPAGKSTSTDIVPRREGAVVEVPRGERQGAVGEQASLVLNKDPSLLSLSYEKYLEYYELVEAAWRLRKVEDLFISTSTQYR